MEPFGGLLVYRLGLEKRIGCRLSPKDVQRGLPFGILPGTDRPLSRYRVMSAAGQS